MSETRTQHKDARTSAGAVWRWLLVGVVGVGVLAVIGANAPPRVRLLGLFAVSFGLTAGLFLGTMAHALGVRRRGFMLVAAFVLIAVGEVGASLGPFLRYRADLIDAALRNARRMPLTAEELSEADARSPAALRRRVVRDLGERISFPVYLAKRTAALGRWPAPWPTVFWTCEVVLGSLVGAWFTGRVSHAAMSHRT